MTRPDHIRGTTWHGRKGTIRNAFSYSIDYVLVDAEAEVSGPSLFARNGRGMAALNDTDHGGAPGSGRGAAWVRDVLSQHGLPAPARIELLAQPRMLGHVFNPVSFWLIRDASDGIAGVIAEVTNTFGDRHSYLCVKDDHTPIDASDRLQARKLMHVSPFQSVAGGYMFTFDITDDRVAIRIDYSDGEEGVLATLAGRRAPLTNAAILSALLRRPFGSRRVLTLIHWQALKLWWKGARYRVRPRPPEGEVSR